MVTTIAEPPPPGSIARRGMLTRLDGLLTGWRLLLAVAILYLGYALFVTWPLATNISGLLSAPNFLEDAAGTTSQFAYLVSHHIFPFVPARMSGLNAPEGFNQTWALNLAQAPSDGLDWVLSLGFGAVAGGNLFMLLGFVASGTSMFAFTKRLFGSRVVALLAGFAFAFYPFPVSAASVHYVFVHGWPMVLCVWGLLEMAHRPDRRNALLAGGATAFAMWWNPYYELLGGFALATMLVITVALGAVRGQQRAALRAAGTALLPVAILGVFFAVVLKLGGGLSSIGSVPRPISQVYAFSAHLWDYLLPGPYNPLVGHLTGPPLTARMGVSDVWDSAVYPGYVVIGLAVLGFGGAVRRLRANRAELADIRTVATLAAGALAMVAFICSLPPSMSVGNFSIRFPSALIYDITPTWQTFSRFVILLELALIIMMAAQLAQLRSSLDARRAAAIFTLIGLLLAVDLWARPPHRTVSTTPAPAYAWLRAHPGGIVADYPLLPGYDPATASALYWGAYDEHPLLQGYWALTSAESMKLDLADLSDPQTASKLAAYGVRYIVVHRGSPGGKPSQLRGEGYRPIIINRHGASLWAVTSLPAQTSVDALSGFDWDSGYPTYDRRLMLVDGVLAVHARGCRTCSGTVSFSVGGIGRALRLTVRNQRTGTVLGQFEVPGTGYARVSVPHVVLVDGGARLGLEMTPRRSNVVILTRTTRLKLQNS
jgi:hypothetical protein